MTAQADSEHDAIRLAVKAGFQDAISDPGTYENIPWRDIHQGITNYATTEAGRFTLGVFGRFWRWLLRIVVVVALLYYLGGPAAVTAWVKSALTS